MKDLHDFPRLKEMAEYVMPRAKKMEEIERSGPEAFTLGNPTSMREINRLEKEKAPFNNEVEQYFNSCSADEVRSLLVLMYVGRDTYDNDENTPGQRFASKSNEIGAAFDDKEMAARQMLEKVPLADYLERGIKMLQL